MPRPFPKNYQGTTVLLATFARDHFNTTDRYLCLLIAQGRSTESRYITFPAPTDEDARQQLILAKLTPTDADEIVTGARLYQELFAAQAGKFIPAGEPAPVTA